MKKFTLLELMVVIAIIGILITILVPSLSRARDEAQGIICINNLAQISVATHIYTNESEWFPEYFRQVEWDMDYIAAQDSGLWECPSDKGSWSYNMHGDTPMNKHGRTTYENDDSSYFWNEYATSQKYKNDGTTNNRLRNNDMKMTRVLDPDEYVLASCAAIRGPYGVADGLTYDHLWHFPGKTRWPIGFADGHASYVRDSRCVSKTLFNGNSSGTPFTIKQDDELIDIPSSP